MATALALLSVILVTLSFVAYIVELRAIHRQNRALGAQNVEQVMHDLNKHFLTMPELHPYFFGGLELPRDDEELRTRVLVLAEMFVDFMSMTLNQAPLLPRDHQQGWRSYFAALVRSSPAIQEYWKENCDWYEGPVWQLIDNLVPRVPPTNGLPARSTEPGAQRS